MKIGIIIQARMGSTRLPGKMGKPFFKQQSLIEVILRNILKVDPDISVVLATSSNSKDDYLEEIGKTIGVKVFRGNENDVLQRFIDAAEHYGITTVVRVCADNPFLSVKYVRDLINEFTEGDDYLSYSYDDGTPTIKSHIGMFAEIVSLSALRKVKTLTNSGFYFEHVTNYIYEHSNEFKVRFLPLPQLLHQRKDIRLTIDTETDFEISKEVFEELMKDSETVEATKLLSIIDGKSELLEKMKGEIERNTK